MKVTLRTVTAVQMLCWACALGNWAWTGGGWHRLAATPLIALSLLPLVATAYYLGWRQGYDDRQAEIRPHLENIRRITERRD